MASPNDPLSPEKQALLVLRKMRAKLEELERARSEPIAIVGLGCRFPGGAVDGDSFWRLLDDGVDAVSEIPRERFDIDALYNPDPDARGGIYTRRGGFVSGIDRFDASFFGIARREAVSLDPQQRLLLEVAWEALENAGQAPDRLRGTKTGVFMGISGGDYAQLQMQRGDRAALDLYFGTGTAPSASACRLSYVLGLVGPSMAVDTACSASLVAVHLASQSLRSGECRLALAGGVNLTLLPEIFINLCLARMLAPDGRCKTFDAAADGYVRGEGCGVVVLKRLSDALSDGDRILALIRSTAVNQDGRSGGFTAPSERSQEELLREAIARAGIAPSDVAYVEAHGTGTPLGDPIEMQALATVLCADRPADRPLTVGSVKTNIGHLEAAAGIAGLIKVVLALQHGAIPPHLHLKQLNPLLSLDGAPVVVPTVRTGWPASDRPRLAGVSSFGFTGTNAHAILEEAPAPQPRPAPGTPDRPLHILALSARTEAALGDLADRYERHLAEAGHTLSDVCFTANTGRAHFAHRLAVAGASGEEVRAALAAWRSGAPRSGAHSSRGRSEGRPEVAFLFTGQGAQYAGMGRQLYETHPLFRQAIERCDEALRQHVGESILPIVYPDTERSSRLDRTAYTQPALFAVEYALAQLWMSWGVEPAVVMGHSLGEYVAACVAGLFSLDDALKLVACRARLMDALPAGGAMAAVFAGEAHVRQILPPDVAIAAVNGPENVVISGPGDRVRDVLARLEPVGVRSERLSVSHAFHSGLMDPILNDFARAAGEVRFTPPRVGVVSNLTGALADPAEMSRAEYWRRHLREPVRFAAGVFALYESGARVFLEIGPSPTLLAMGRRLITDEGVTWLPSLRKGRDDWKQMLDALGQLYAGGVDVDWARFDAGYGRRKVALPTYPFQRQSYWIDVPAEARPAAPAGAGERVAPPDAESGDLLYEVVWEDAEPAPPGRAPIDRWVIFADARGLGAALARRVADSGAQAVLVSPGTAYRRTTSGFEIDPADRAHYRALLEEIVPAGGSQNTVFAYLWASGESSDGAAPLGTDAATDTLGCEALMRLAQALAEHRGPAPRLWIGTRGAQPAASAPLSVAQGAVWGFGRVLALEHPEIWGGLVDLEPGAVEGEASALLQEISIGAEEQVALRSGRRLVPRLIELAPRSTGGVTLSADATYLITGGLGSLGLEVANWMADRGAKRLVLVGRSGLPDRERWDESAGDPGLRARIAAVLRLEQSGVEVRIVRADATDRARMASLVRELAAAPHPLRGVVHAAGVSRRALVQDMDAADLRAVLHPKVAGAWILHELTTDLPLDLFVLFSSISAVWGSKGLAHYAAANAFLDALAHHRRAAGLPALSVNWGPWSGGGMASADDLHTLALMGVRPLEREAALRALGELLGGESAQATAAHVDWNVFKPVYGARSGRRLLDRIGGAAAGRAPASAADADLARLLQNARHEDRSDLLVSALQQEVASVLGESGAALPDPHDRFFEVGMDSLMAVELRRRLETRLGVSLPATLAFDYPSVARLAEHLAGVLRFDRARPQEPVPERRASSETLDKIAELSEEEIDRIFAERVLSSGA